MGLLKALTFANLRQPVVVQHNSGNFKFNPKARANANGANTKSKMQKLWMFNMGYEHHEQVFQAPQHAGASVRGRARGCVQGGTVLVGTCCRGNTPLVRARLRGMCVSLLSNVF